MKEKGAVQKCIWTVEEDQVLLDLVSIHGPKKWSVIAQSLPGRIGKQCRERWHNHLNPAVRKDSWTPEEDAIISELVSQMGTKWASIAKHLQGRTDNSIKNRYYSSLKKLHENRKSSLTDPSDTPPTPKRRKQSIESIASSVCETEMNSLISSPNRSVSTALSDSSDSDSAEDTKTPPLSSSSTPLSTYSATTAAATPSSTCSSIADFSPRALSQLHISSNNRLRELSFSLPPSVVSHQDQQLLVQSPASCSPIDSNSHLFGILELDQMNDVSLTECDDVDSPFEFQAFPPYLSLHQPDTSVHGPNDIPLQPLSIVSEYHSLLAYM
eukprot:c3802_g1_i1.p1 GENE.c3802_g1_i1~~c3802_g1_i1.p1  ORF type:complete len:326 (-),score=45.86 c3802_g1_i1:162-1139(-)